MPISSRTQALSLFAALSFSAPALASSDSAWETMRADVARKCIAAAAGTVRKPTAVVDPFGSESFGLALVSGKPSGGKAKITRICIYNKQTKTVELGSELTPDMLKGQRP